MPLLKEVKHGESGLEGLTEDDKLIPLGVPIPAIEHIPRGFLMGGPGDIASAAASISWKAERDSENYYHIVECGMTVAIYNKYPKRDS